MRQTHSLVLCPTTTKGWPFERWTRLSLLALILKVRYIVISSKSMQKLDEPEQLPFQSCKTLLFYRLRICATLKSWYI